MCPFCSCLLADSGLSLKSRRQVHSPKIAFTSDSVLTVHFVFARIPRKSYHRRHWSLLLCFCDVFRALVNSLVCWCLFWGVWNIKKKWYLWKSDWSFSWNKVTVSSLFEQNLIMEKQKLLITPAPDGTEMLSPLAVGDKLCGGVWRSGSKHGL